MCRAVFLLLGKSFSSTFVLVALHGDGQHPVGVATVIPGRLKKSDCHACRVLIKETWHESSIFSWPSPPGCFVLPESVHVNNKQKNGRRRKAERQEPERRTHAQLLFLLVQAKWEHCEGLTLQRPKKDADAKSRELHFLLGWNVDRSIGRFV